MQAWAGRVELHAEDAIIKWRSTVYHKSNVVDVVGRERGILTRLCIYMFDQIVVEVFGK